MKTWILVANRAEARLFAYPKKQNSQVQFVERIENPRGRLKDQDINADKPGFFNGWGYNASGMSKGQSPTERVAQEFAKELMDRLNLERSKNSFEELILIAEPSFLGRLRSCMSKELEKCVVKEIAKDLGAVATPEIQDRLF